jgi:adenine-specific DNA-methyltransferase
MQNLQTNLIELLKGEGNLVVDNNLNKNKIIEAALKVEPFLISLLIKNDTFKKHFFQEVEDVLVFDKIKFQRFVNNKSFLPDSYTAFKNKIGLAINDDATDNYLQTKNDVVLAWPHKDCVLEGGQTKEDQKRNEIFWNETLAPDNVDRLLDAKAFTNFKKYDKKGEHKVTEIKGDENLILKGNNLLVISSLLKTHRGKIKLIYIDPPYNTGGNGDTFEYNNSFKRSTWLTFMKNRLEVAKQLLKPDGALIVAIDENEQAHLGVLLKELFKDKETHCITIVHNPRGVQGTNFSYTHEYAFFVVPKGLKTINNKIKEEKDIKWSNLRNWGGESLRSDAKNCFYPILINPENSEIESFGDICPDDFTTNKREILHENLVLVYPVDNDGIERKWRYSRQSVENVKKFLRARIKNGQWDIEIGKNFEQYRTVWISPKYDANEYGSKIVKDLVPDAKFSFPKSIWNVYDCIYAVVGEDSNAMILDYHAGSGTTAHAVLEINKLDDGNRKFIMCEQLDYVEAVTTKRIQKVIENQNSDNNFVFAELMEYNQYFINKIQIAKTKENILAIWREMQDKAFISYQFNKDSFNKNLEAFKTASMETMQHILIEVLDKNQLYINFSEIEDKAFRVSEEDKALNYSFYNRK